jgi:hypothetical protein
MNNHQRFNQLIGLWIIMLVIMLPIYSANVSAVSIRVTKNTGNAGVPKFIDGGGDEWVVETTIGEISETDVVSSENVFMKVAGNEQNFDTCREDPAGTVCEYTSDLSVGVPEDEYPFEVIYRFNSESVKRRSTVKAENSAPEITNLRVSQAADGKIDILFDVHEVGDFPVGLDKVEVIDADSGTVLIDVTGIEGKTELLYQGIITQINSGDEVKRVKVRASDLLGHVTESEAVSFRVDFIAPTVGKVNFTDMGRFIGNVAIESDLKVDFMENSRLSRVTVSSAQTSLENDVADSCLRDDENFQLWHCTWNRVRVKPEEVINLEFKVKDGKNNEGVASKEVRFIKDSFAPEIVFFGTERMYEGESYISNKRNDNRIILNFKEEGVGISKDGIRANLNSVGLTGTFNAPTDFNVTTSTAYWDVGGPPDAEVVNIGLTIFKDLVGNQAESLLESTLVVDNAEPIIDRIELFGFSSEGDKQYFQSNDALKIVFTAKEESGMTVLVNMNDLINDAKFKYPKTGITHSLGDGWRVFTQDDGNCERVAGRWECSILTEPLRSGSGEFVDVEIKIQDTAGNDVTARGGWEKTVDAKNVQNGEKGKYKIQLLGILDDEEPNYWGLSGKPRLLYDHIDLDVAKIGSTRMPVKVTLNSDESLAKVVGVELVGCKSNGIGPDVKRSLIYSGLEQGGSRNPILNLVVEFDQFDSDSLILPDDENKFKEALGDYSCEVQVLTKLGLRAIDKPELVEFSFEVPFAFSTLGALDQNLAQRIKDVKEGDFFQFADAISFLAIAVKWLNFFSQLYQIVVTVNQLIALFTTTAKTQVATIKATILADKLGGEAWIQALKLSCFSATLGGDGMMELVNYGQIFFGLLSCNPSAADNAGLGWYAWWQKSILDLYNLLSGRGVLGVPANSLYENLYTASFGLCLPGIIYNIEKAREVHCRKIICLGREVPAGFATVEMCDNMYDIMMCEFVWGPFWDFVGLGGLSQIGKLVQSLFYSPLGVIGGAIAIAEYIACDNLCYVEVTVGDVQACKTVQGIDKTITLIDNFVGAIQTAPAVTQERYCGQIDDIKLEELSGGQFIESEEDEEEGEEDPSTTPSTTGGVGTVVGPDQEVRNVDPQGNVGAPVSEGRTPGIVNP